MEGAPNSNLDTYNKKDGTFSSRRKFGKDGKAKKDHDVADHHKKDDHVHDIKGKNRDALDRQPTKKEQREINKAKKETEVLEMIDLREYVKDSDELEYLEELRACEKCFTETSFDYKGREFIIEPHGERICVYENVEGSSEYFYQDMDDFFLNFRLDGKPFIECVSEIAFSE